MRLPACQGPASILQRPRRHLRHLRRCPAAVGSHGHGLPPTKSGDVFARRVVQPADQVDERRRTTFYVVFSAATAEPLRQGPPSAGRAGDVTRLRARGAWSTSRGMLLDGKTPTNGDEFRRGRRRVPTWANLTSVLGAAFRTTGDGTSRVREHDAFHRMQRIAVTEGAGGLSAIAGGWGEGWGSTHIRWPRPARNEMLKWAFQLAWSLRVETMSRVEVLGRITRTGKQPLTSGDYDGAWIP